MHLPTQVSEGLGMDALWVGLGEEETVGCFVQETVWCGTTNVFLLLLLNYLCCSLYILNKQPHVTGTVIVPTLQIGKLRPL